MAFASWSTTNTGNNATLGIDIAEGCAAGNMNNGLREAMAQLRTAIAPVWDTLLAEATTADIIAALGLNTIASVPTGTLIHVAKSSAPTGYLKCNGAAVSRTTYADLFAAIGTTFGSGDGSTTFNLPDLRGEFLRGYDDGRGVDTSRVFGSAQADELKSHTHNLHVFSRDIDGNGDEGDNTVATFSTGVSGYIDATGGSETRPRNVAVLICIKT